MFPPSPAALDDKAQTENEEDTATAEEAVLPAERSEEESSGERK